MPKPIEIKPGDVFGRLVIISEIGGLPRKFKCKCECGNITDKWLSNLRNKGKRGATLSCGCIRTEATVGRNFVHGMAYTVPEYGVWMGIRKRCSDVEDMDYGGRGISVCQEWNEFPVFYRDMGPRPSPLHTIERIDVNSGYTKDNCRWATRKEQNRNTRVNSFLVIYGERKCVAEWDEYFATNRRLKAGQFKSRYYKSGIAGVSRMIGVEVSR